MSPTTARQAALEVLLEEVEPLLERTEELAVTLTTLHGQLQADSAALSTLVREGLEAQPILLEAARRLGGAAGRIEVAATSMPLGSARLVQSTARCRWWAHALNCAAMAATAAALVLWIADVPRSAHARLGQALERAWPALDAGTRAKVEQAMQQAAGSH